MADLGTILLGTFTNINDTAITGTEPVLQAIASPDDAKFVRDATNSTHTGVAQFALGDTPVDFGNMDTLSIQLRYGLSTALTLNTWDSLQARVFESDGVTPLTDLATIASGITTTTPTNSSVINFTGLNTTADKTTWDAAVVRISFNITRNKGGDTADERVYAAQVTGTYTEGAPDPVNVTPNPVTVTWGVNQATLSFGGVEKTPDPLVSTWSVTTPSIVQGGINLTPDAVISTWSVATPSIIQGDVNLSSDPVSISWGTVEPVITTPSIDINIIPIDPAGLTLDGHTVFITGIDSIGRKVTKWATPSSPGFVDDGTQWTVVSPSSILFWSVITPVAESVVDIHPTSTNVTWSTVNTVISIGVINVSPDPVIGTWNTVDPTIFSRINISPDPVVGTWSVITPSIVQGDINLSSDPVVTTWLIIAPSIQTSGQTLITNQGSLGATQSKPAGNSIQHTTTGIAEANKLLIVVVAKDNVSGSDGETNEILSIQDSVNNTYTKVKEFTNGEGSSEMGATVAIFYSRIVTELPSGGWIKANFSEIVPAACISVQKYSVEEGKSIQLVTTGTLQDDAQDPGSMSASGLTSSEYLFFRGIASESSSPTALTPSSGYTIITGAQTS